MDIKQLNVFAAVFEEKNMTLAANRMNITQPTLSTCIKLIEEELGVLLFIRQPRGVLPTDAARTLYAKARKLLSDFDHMMTSMTSDQMHLSLTLGIQSDIANHSVQHAIQTLYRLEPNLSLNLKQGCTGDLRLVTQDQCCEDELFTPLFSDPYGVVISKNIIPDSDELLPNNFLAKARWVNCPEHRDYQRLLPIYQQYSCSVSTHAENLHLCRTIVASGVAIAFLPQSFALDDSSLRFFSSRHPLPIRQIGLCYAHHQLEHPLIEKINRILTNKESIH